MSKRVVRGVAGVAVLAILGAGGAWFVAAGNAVKATEQAIAELASKPRPDGSTLTITHAGIARAGFPAVGVRVENPTLTLTLPAREGASAITMTWAQEGDVSILSDYLAHEYRLVQQGGSTGKIEGDGKKMGIRTTPAEVHLRVKAKSYAAFLAWNQLNLDDAVAVEKAAKDVAKFDIAMGALRIHNLANDAVIASQESATLSIANRSTEQQVDMDMALHSKAAEATKEYANLAQELFVLLHLPIPTEGIMDMAADAGKQDTDIELRVNAPKPSGKSTPNAEIHADTFYVKNNFYTLNAPTHVVLKEDALNRNASVQIDWLLEVTPLAGQMVAKMRPAMRPMAAGESNAAAQPQWNEMLPTLSTLGPITLKVDIKGGIPTPEARKNGGKLTEHVSIRALSLDHKRWGLSLTGKGIRSDSTSATLEGTVQCKKCDAFTKDSYEAAKNIQKWLPSTVSIPLMESMLPQLDAALAEIGTKDAATGDISFAISTPAPNDVRVNDKPVGEVMAKLMAAFVPVSTATPAAAGESEAH